MGIVVSSMTHSITKYIHLVSERGTCSRSALTLMLFLPHFVTSPGGLISPEEKRDCLVFFPTFLCHASTLKKGYSPCTTNLVLLPRFQLISIQFDLNLLKYITDSMLKCILETRAHSTCSMINSSPSRRSPLFLNIALLLALTQPSGCVILRNLGSLGFCLSRTLWDFCLSMGWRFML